MAELSGALSREDFLRGILRFAAAGLFSTGLYFVTTNALIAWLDLAPFLASLVAYCICIVSSFILQSRMVFRYAGDRRKALVKFAVLALSGLVAAQAIFWFSTDVMGARALYASLFVSLAIPVVNFVAMNFWVFVERNIAR